MMAGKGRKRNKWTNNPGELAARTSASGSDDYVPKGTGFLAASICKRCGERVYVGRDDKRKLFFLDLDQQTQHKCEGTSW